MSEEVKDIKMTAKERRKVLLRTLKLNEQADKGYTLRLTLGGILSLASEYLFILLISFITNGIASGKELRELIVSTAAVAAVCLGTQIVIKFINRRESSHKFKHDFGLVYIMNKKLMNMDYVHLESPDMQNRYNMCVSYLSGWRGVSAVPELVGDITVAVFRIMIGAALIIPSVMQSPADRCFALPTGLSVPRRSLS